MPPQTAKAKVLVVDDSAAIRKILCDHFEASGDLEVVGAAEDPYVARDLLERKRPDVMTLDVEMPRMDGLSFLKLIMKHNPIPTVVVSSITQRGSDNAAAALEAGAVDVLGKPRTLINAKDFLAGLTDSVRKATRGFVRPAALRPTPAAPTAESAPAAHGFAPNQIIALAASTGGVAALRTLLSGLPPNAPPVVVVQHISADFSRSVAASIGRDTALQSAEASQGEILRNGTVRMAPGGHHLVIDRVADGYRCRLWDGPPVHHQRPAADVLLASVARAAGANAVGAVLTGMGEDGAQGLLAMRHEGARCFAQDDATSAVYGMPREALAVGAAERAIALQSLAPALVRALRRGS